MDWVVSRCGMNLDNVMDEGCLRMRGLPYGCTKEEVAAFFSGMVDKDNLFEKQLLIFILCACIVVLY